MRMPEATTQRPCVSFVRWPMMVTPQPSSILGLMYATGQGVQQDNAAAALWFRKAAEQGYALAQSNLETLWHRRPHRQLTKILLVMVRLSLI